MESACIRHVEIPGTSRLFLDLLYHFDRVEQFYPHPPVTAAIPDSIREMQYPDDRRAALVAALRLQNGDHPALEILAQPGSVAVVTGQQVGLFSGPSYTVYKAITAAKVARRLTEQGIPAVPVFWLATEDHDFEEIAQAWVYDGQHRPVGLRVEHPNPEHSPVGKIPLPPAPLDALRAALKDEPFGDEVMERVAAAYRPGRTMGQAFQQLVASLLEPLRLLYLDPLAPEIREMAAPVLADAVRASAALSAKLLERNQELEHAGYHAQVHIEASTSLFFLLDGERRVTLKRKNGRFAGDGREYSIDELAERSCELSPNAVLRPVVQDYLLPTATYIGGPAELAYMAQSQVLYRELLHRMPVVMPRTGFTLLDARTAKLWRRYDLHLGDFAHGEDGLKQKIARRLIPEALSARFESTESATAALVVELRTELASFDPTLADALDKSAAKIQYQLQKVHRKTGRETLRRDERAASEAALLAHAIYPHKHLQERFYTILPFLAQHGLDLVERLYEAAHVECPDHILLTL